MFCQNCGSQLADDSRFCSKCGAQQPLTSPVTQTETVVQPIPYAIPVPPAAPKKKTGIIIAAVAAAAVLCITVVLAGYLAISHMAKENLHEQLLRDWSRVEESDGFYYTLELDFSEDAIEYTFDSYSYYDVLYNYTYEVVSGDTIEVNGSEYTVEINDDKTMIIISPALTSLDSYEYWYNFD